MTVKLGMTHAQLINAINSDIDLIKDQGSKIITKEFPASETETSSVQLDTKCQSKDYMFVFMDYGILEPSKYSLSADGLTVNFSPAIPANHKIIIRYFTPGSSFTNYVTDEFQSNLLNYTTNRILEIPQDIKLELNNGTLTLKTGSKVYVPNGDGVFDAVTISTDRSLTNTSNDTYMVFAKSDGSGIELARLANQTGSGTTTPTSSWWAYYNTSDNKVYRIENGVNVRQLALPLAIVTVSGGAISSIDQIFNGFGYIGSTVFALPGVKVQIPNGRNADGTCNSEIIVNSKVNLYSATGTAYVDIVLLQNGIFAYTKTNLFYDSEKNLVKHKNGSIIYGTTIASCWNKNKIVSDFLRYDVDSVVNSNASNFSQAGRSYLSGLGMPSGRYIDLTLGASGSTYTAPANGYFFCARTATAAGQLLQVEGGNSGFEIWSQGAHRYSLTVPVRKGQVVYLYYTMPTANIFRFVYAEGEN